MQRLRCLVRKEFLELRQNPRLFGIVIVAPIIQLTMLGYAATTDVKDVPVVVADGDRSPESRTLIARFDASVNFTVVDTVTTVAGSRSVSAARPRLDCAAIFRRATGAPSIEASRSRCRSSPTAPTRTRRPSRSATRRRWSASTRRSSLARSRPRRRSTRDRSTHRLQDSRLVQPAAREPLLHDPRRAGAAAPARDRQPRRDGDRAREGAGHARAAERDAAPPLGADRRQAAAVRRHRADRRAAGDGCRGVLVRGAVARQLLAAPRDEPALRPLHARRSACSSRRSPTRSSRR